MAIDHQAALQAVRKVIATLPEGHEPLRAEYVRAGFDVDAGVSILRASDGRPHVVGVQVGHDMIGANVSGYETKDLGDGMSVSSFAWMSHGLVHKRLGAAFEASLAKALTENADAFEPVAGPGCGTHPRTAETIELARIAISARAEDAAPLTMRLNADGQADGSNDVVTFHFEDGSLAPVALRTGPGMAILVDSGDGRTIETFEFPPRRGTLPERLAECFEAMEASPTHAP